jgi:DNA-binding GntR family transcriptional regulator
MVADSGSNRTKAAHGGKRTAEILAYLEKEILEGRIAPGERLDETELAARFEVSRTPVREALLQLATHGLIETGKRRGAIVSRIPVERIVAMMEVLSVLEGCAARLAARRMTPDEQVRLRAAHDASAKFVQTNQVEGFDDSNKQIHELIYQGCKNEYLAGQIRDLRRRLWVWVYRGYPFQKPGRIEISFRDHGNVINAIISGDDAAADRLMQEHISVGASDLAGLIVNIAELNRNNGNGAAS